MDGARPQVHRHVVAVARSQDPPQDRAGSAFRARSAVTQAPASETPVPGRGVLVRAAYRLGRSARNGLLWLAEPADRIGRLIRKREGLPPLWLRRHTGPLSAYENSADEMLRLIDQLGLVRPADTTLDVGCGTGVMVPGLLARAGPDGAYVGFDVHPHALRWCQEHYGSDPRCRFELARVASPYGTRRGTPVERFEFPIEDDTADLVLAKSVFTHLVAAEARRYLEEIRRVLRPGRAALVTAFLFEKGSRTAQGSSRAFPHTEATGRMRWRSRLMPESGVAYERLYFAELVERAGLHVDWLCPGFLPGDGDDPAGQDILLLGH